MKLSEANEILIELSQKTEDAFKEARRKLGVNIDFLVAKPDTFPKWKGNSDICFGLIAQEGEIEIDTDEYFIKFIGKQNTLRR